MFGKPTVTYFCFLFAWFWIFDTKADWRTYALANYARIGSDNVFSPIWRQAVGWSNVGSLLISSLRSNFTVICSKIRQFSWKWIQNIACTTVTIFFRRHYRNAIPYVLIIQFRLDYLIEQRGQVGIGNSKFDVSLTSLQWRHNGRDSVAYHQHYDCLLNRLFRCRSKKTSKLCVTGLCVGNSQVAGEFPAQRASYAENVSIWWRHHGKVYIH